MEKAGLVVSAVAFATSAHEGQVRKGGRGIPYITHPLAVKAILEGAGVTDQVVLAAAVLHDTIEDCGVTQAALEAEFGPEVALVVAEVSDAPGLSKTAAKKAQERNAPFMSERAKLVKLADKTANLTDIVENPPGWKPEAVRGYATSAKRIVAAMGSVHEALETGFAAAAKRAMDSAG